MMTRRPCRKVVIDNSL